ncbi:hypothetical protein LFM09_21400 [Lentzea alba]
MTDEGRELVAATSEVLGELFDEVLGRLPQADRAPFLRSLALSTGGRAAR